MKKKTKQIAKTTKNKQKNIKLTTWIQHLRSFLSISLVNNEQKHTNT